MTKSRIAIALALLFAAPAAVVAFDQYSSADASIEVVPVTVSEVTEAEMITISEQEITVEPVAVYSEQTVLVPVESQAEVIAAEPRIEFAYDSKTFPTGTDDLKLLPRQAAFLERQHQQRSSQLSIASAAWNPGSTEPDLDRPLPAQVAYFDRKEQQVLASMQSEIVASSDSRSRTSQLAMADTASPSE